MPPEPGGEEYSPWAPPGYYGDDVPYPVQDPPPPPPPPEQPVPAAVAAPAYDPIAGTAVPITTQVVSPRGNRKTPILGIAACALATVLVAGLTVVFLAGHQPAPAPTPSLTPGNSETPPIQPTSSWRTGTPPAGEPGATLTSLPLVPNESDGDFELGVDSSVVREDHYGRWNPAKLPSDSLIYDLTDEYVAAQSKATGWTKKEVKKAFKLAVDFAIDELLDSELVWDDTVDNRERVVKRLRGKYITSGDKAIAQAVSDPQRCGDPPIDCLFDQNIADWRGADLTGYPSVRPAPYQLGAPRYGLTSYWVDEDSDVIGGRFVFSLEYIRQVLLADGSPLVEESWLTAELIVAKKSGKLRITGLGDTQGHGHSYVGTCEPWTALDYMPTLAETTVPDDWYSYRALGLAFALPADWAQTDHDADGETEILIFEPPVAADTWGNQMSVQASLWAVQGYEDRLESVTLDDQYYAIHKDGLNGYVRVTGQWDSIQVILRDETTTYDFQADVPPSGWGLYWAKLIVGGMHAA
ncbi:MAG: hypothetical protein LBR58_10530 [Propionibacteriaceae bacterium]|jgi:hypothetical protein|nr:hypothetical protein [Propionibacteriaceae bacterium]